MNYKEPPILGKDFDSLVEALDNKRRILLNTLIELQGQIKGIQGSLHEIDEVMNRIVDNGQPDNLSEENLKKLDDKLREQESAKAS